MLGTVEYDYGLDYIDAKAPFPIKFEFKEGQVIVTFATGKMGVSPIHTDLSGFELAGLITYALRSQFFLKSRGNRGF